MALRALLTTYAQALLYRKRSANRPLFESEFPRTWTHTLQFDLQLAGGKLRVSGNDVGRKIAHPLQK